MARRKRHKPEEIVRKLQEADVMLRGGSTLAQVLQKLETSETTYHRWRAEFDGVDREQVRRMKELEEENRRLKTVVADQALDIRMLKDVVEGKL
jgi:hypothetical protein